MLRVAGASSEQQRPPEVCMRARTALLALVGALFLAQLVFLGRCNPRWSPVDEE